MEHRNWIKKAFLLMAMAAAVAAPARAAPTPAPSKTVVVVVDVSSSISADDRNKAYRESFVNALSVLKPGDRLVLGTVGARGRSTWQADFDAASPLGTGFRIADERKAAEFGKKASEAFHGLLERGERNPENATRIADAVEAASEAFSADPRNARVLLVLSDMEESGSRPVKTRKAPAALEGASVYVAGAGGGQKYAEYEAVWRAYFGTARGAEVIQYGRFPARITVK